MSALGEDMVSKFGNHSTRALHHIHMIWSFLQHDSKSNNAGNNVERMHHPQGAREPAICCSQAEGKCHRCWQATGGPHGERRLLIGLCSRAQRCATPGHVPAAQSSGLNLAHR